MNDSHMLDIADVQVGPGETRDLELRASQDYSGRAIDVPIRVWRGPAPGPVVFITAAVHGDELNGTGAVREVILNPPFELTCGSLVLVPVVNVLGFERRARYLPDRRDLNRCFPGSAEGSMASRLAHTIFRKVLVRCDYGIDLHTAALRRTNFPHVRGDLKDPAVRHLAQAFGSEVIVNARGPRGSLRRAACAAGCAAIMLEAGEVWKVEPTVLEYAVRGIRNVLIGLGLIKGKPRAPTYQAVVERSTWLRASAGGILQFHVAPGDVVPQGAAIATQTTLLGRPVGTLTSPVDGIVLGMSTLPSTAPGDPVCHLAIPQGGIEPIRAAVAKASGGSLHERLRDDLASSLTISRAAKVAGDKPDP
jgi:predicted deacylase